MSQRSGFSVKRRVSLFSIYHIASVCMCVASVGPYVRACIIAELLRITMLILANRQRIVACRLLCNENERCDNARACVVRVRVHYAIACSRPCASRHKHRVARCYHAIHVPRPSLVRISRRVANRPLHDRVHRLGKRLSARPMQFHTRIHRFIVYQQWITSSSFPQKCCAAHARIPVCRVNFLLS